MDLKSEILRRHSKAHTMKIVHQIGNDSDRFGELVDLTLEGEAPYPQRASWVMRYCVEAHPSLILPHLKNLVKNLDQPIHDAVKRNTIKSLTYIEVPESLWGEVADICFRLLASPQETVAVRVFAIEVLYEICKKVPELSGELKLVIEEHFQHGTAGFRSKARKILKDLAKLQDQE